MRLLSVYSKNQNQKKKNFYFYWTLLSRLLVFLSTFCFLIKCRRISIQFVCISYLCMCVVADCFHVKMFLTEILKYTLVHMQYAFIHIENSFGFDDEQRNIESQWHIRYEKIQYFYLPLKWENKGIRNRYKNSYIKLFCFFFFFNSRNSCVALFNINSFSFL